MADKVRFKQRLENFTAAFLYLTKIVNKENLSDFERTGLIKAFEIAFEVGWKTLKDYLESELYIIKSPRDVIKQAFEYNIIQNGFIWMQALESRNESVHLYDEMASRVMEKAIKDSYYPLLKDLHQKLVSFAQ